MHISNETICIFYHQTGTLWCGPGNAATGNRKKLGFYAKTDSCCRAHDHCSPFIKPSTYDNVTGLYNEALISFR